MPPIFLFVLVIPIVYHKYQIKKIKKKNRASLYTSIGQGLKYYPTPCPFK